MKGIYLASYRAVHPGFNIVYQDINGLRDLGGDMLDIELSDYDFIIASPPCNFWSRSNYRRYESDYSLNTRHLLPCILLKCLASGKPFLIENVMNRPLMSSFGLFSLPVYVYFIGRHTYWSNVYIDFSSIYCLQTNENIQNKPQYNRQGGSNVFYVVDYFLKIIHERF